MSQCGRLAASLLLAFLVVPLHPQNLAVWRDPSPHTTRFVAVDKDVRLEVLDWGGSGRPIVLLAGGGISEREGDVIVTYNHMVAVHPVAGTPDVKVYDFYRMAEEKGPRLTLLDDFSVAAIRASNDGVEHLGRGE